MKKNVLRKGILVLLVITLLTIGFTGCDIITPPPITTGTVYITIGGYYDYLDYNIYVDSSPNPIGTTWGGSLTITGVPPGWHTFYAYDEYGQNIWNSEYRYIQAGPNYITISPY
jgi:hypothetical protein